MAKGVIYVCSTVVEGLIKIGKTTDFEGRMYHLEHNGYCNVAGLRREFAIEVENYAEKEDIIHKVLKSSQVGESELFSVELESAIKLLSSFEGKMIYPQGKTKEEMFDEATEAVKVAEEEAEEKAGRAVKPKLDWMLNNNLVQVGDKVYYKNKPTEKAEIQAKANVKYEGKNMSLLAFAKHVTGWDHVNAYRHLIHEASGKTLFELREAKMKELGL